MKRIAVAMGGPSTEHDVSLKSGMAVARNLVKAGFDVLPMWIDRDLDVNFCLPDKDCQDRVDLWGAIDRLKREVDCVFIALHGPFGEDGTFQAILEARGIPFTGSDHVGAAIAMDKVLSKRVYESVGLKVPPYLVFESEQCKRSPKAIAEKVLETLGLPVVIKSPRQGSSFGISLVKDASKLPEQVENIAGFGKRVLFEGFIKGRELTVPVLDGHDGPQALPVIEILVHSHDFFDYESKYDPNLTDEVCPAPIPDELANRLGQAGVIAHNSLMLKGFSRSDFIVTPESDIYILETNDPWIDRSQPVSQSSGHSRYTISGIRHQAMQTGNRKIIAIFIT